jgi:pectate lyase
VKKAPSVLVRPDAETTAIRTVDSNISEPVETSYYSVNGSQQPRLQKGINIVKTRYSDGKVETKKIFVR